MALTWISCLTVRTSIITWDRLDQVLKSAFIARLLPLAKSSRHGGGENDGLPTRLRGGGQRGELEIIAFVRSFLKVSLRSHGGRAGREVVRFALTAVFKEWKKGVQECL